ncbi:hypothetical protein FNV43_RR23127 [Rhamnella rubrinervis]|uniref:Uncharacterized protein n=1 Tax=Rhamnella rubrinervis TaxID=2594499 RepID=A0A8K0DYC6_9ROSA|nr:hypothetical protein FNV43_RR23127 [Rhamnella rubrinervis]
MAKAPSLISLCVEAVKKELLCGDDLLPVIYELPFDLFDMIVARAPPLALQKLQIAMPFMDRNDHEYADDYGRNGRKRGRYWNFDAAWRNLFKSRWPKLVNEIQPSDWQQMYWETHLQNCLDYSAEIALIPNFEGCIAEIEISDGILKSIGYEGCMKSSTCDYSKLSSHCQQFGHYARCLRLQSFLTTTESSQLFRNSKLQSLVLMWVRSKEHVDGLCKLLHQNSESLASLEFFHCKLSPAAIEKICGSLLIEGLQIHGIQHFSMNTVSLLETNPVSLPPGLVSFLSSGRSLNSLKFACNNLGRNFAKMVFNTLLDASSCLSELDLSENNIGGWLSDFNWRLTRGAGKSLQSLRVLNLRGSNLDRDDANDLTYALVHMPNLEVLDISDNPIEDDGIRNLIPYFVKASENSYPFTDLSLENCELSCDGVTKLINTLSTLKNPLKSLSIADNSLGSKIAATLGKYLSTSVQVLNISGIGLDSSGFQDLQQSITEELKLVEINISKNRGGIETAKFLSKLILRAPELVSVNAAYNLVPIHGSSIVFSALKAAKGKLGILDVTGNSWDHEPTDKAMLEEFQRAGRPLLIINSTRPKDGPYDDDP